MNIWRKKTQQASKLMLTSGPMALAPKNLGNLFNRLSQRTCITSVHTLMAHLQSGRFPYYKTMNDILALLL